MFIIKTTVILPKYVTPKRGRIYWHFVDLQNAVDSVNGEALWYKVRKKGLSTGIAMCTKSTCETTEFCVKCERDQVTEPIPKETWSQVKLQSEPIFVQLFFYR